MRSRSRGRHREQPIEFADIRKRYLPECVAHTKAEHHQSEYGLRAAAMVRGGVDPGLLEEVVWWQARSPDPSLAGVSRCAW